MSGDTLHCKILQTPSAGRCLDTHGLFRKLEKVVAVRNSLLESFPANLGAAGKFFTDFLAARNAMTAKAWALSGKENGCWRIGPVFWNAPGFFPPSGPPQPSWAFLGLMLLELVQASLPWNSSYGGGFLGKGTRGTGFFGAQQGAASSATSARDLCRWPMIAVQLLPRRSLFFLLSGMSISEPKVCDKNFEDWEFPRGC